MGDSQPAVRHTALGNVAHSGFTMRGIEGVWPVRASPRRANLLVAAGIMWCVIENPDEEGIEFRARLDALLAELSAHPGRRAHAKWTGLRDTMDLHARNLSELIALMHRAETDVETAMELIQNSHVPTVRDEFNAQLDQRLHNAVASTVTLIDHLRRVVADYEGSALPQSSTAVMTRSSWIRVQSSFGGFAIT
jgi:hypothetical protein